jgi:DHA1 family bicyclomycin/chloramphenicol resistance-like MFS transporter
MDGVEILNDDLGPAATASRAQASAFLGDVQMNSNLVKTAIILGLLSLIGPVAIDMYLPSLPAIGETLNATTSEVQLSLISFMAAIALGQLAYGPVSDMIGRKPPLYFGIVLFIAGSVGAALSTSIEWLVVFRVVQGIGACASFALPRAIVRDNYTGVEAAQLMSLLMLVFSISPILAPLAGSVVILFGDYRLVFWSMTAVGILVLLLAIFALRETRPKALRVESSLGSALSAYRTLLVDWNFLGLTLIGAFGIGSFMGFIGNSSFVFIEHYGLNPTLYSVAFSVNAVGFFALSQMTAFFARRFGLSRVVRVAVTGFAVTMIALFAIFAMGVDSMWVLSGFMFVAFSCLGLVVPSTAVLAMEEHGPIAGTASALMGTLQLVVGAVVMGIVGVFFDGTAMPMIAGFAACGLIAWLLTLATLRGTAQEQLMQRAPAE